MRQVEPISKKIRKLYGGIVKNERQSIESTVKRLYRNAFKDDGRKF
jgi:hypothetical protein